VDDVDEVDGKDGAGKNLEHRLLIERRQSISRPNKNSFRFDTDRLGMRN
jgi:hypothetical protein